jgi:hypothetical protein
MNDPEGLQRSSITAQQGSIAVGGDVGGDVHIHWTSTEAPNRPQFKRYLRMLAVVAAPVVGATVSDPPPAPLDLWAEWRRLEESIRGAWDEVHGRGAPWAVVRLNPPTRHQLADAMVTGDAASAYQVVHFSGHGGPNGLALENDLGCTDFVTDDELVDLFCDRPVRLVVFNACRTEALAQRLHAEAGVPAVIATTDSLRDDEARLLTARLYAQLARGCLVAEAFAEARAAFRHAYERGELPVPLSRRADPQSYIAERLDVPLLLGDAHLTLPTEEKCAQRPFITLAEPPPRGMAMHLIEGFVGRGPELVRIAHWLRDRHSPLIALSGLGGIGKSALAAMAVLRNSWRFRAVVCLSAQGDPHLKPKSLISPLDSMLDEDVNLASASTETEQLERVIVALNQNPTLLVLDNLESLTEEAVYAWADFLGHLDPRRGSVAILTLRPAVKHPLTDLSGIAHLPLDRLSKPDALRLLVDGLTVRELWSEVPLANDLSLSQREQLEHLAKQAHLDWPSPVRLAALDELATKAGRHPYTLRLALGDLRYPHVDWAKVSRNISDLRGTDWETEAEKMVGQMISDLARVESKAVSLLYALSVFRAGATYKALHTVFTPDDNRVNFDDYIRAALDASLLEFDKRANRYDLHPLTRSFLANQEDKREDYVLFVHRYMEYFREWMKDHSEEYDLFERELPNLTKAFKLTCQNVNDSEAIFKQWDTWFFFLRGYWKVYDHWTTLALEAMERLGDEQTRAKILVDYGALKTEQYELEKAERVLAEGRAILEELGQRGDLKRLCSAILFQGYVAYRKRDFHSAKQYAKKARGKANESQYYGHFASSTNLLAQIASKENKVDEARKLFSEVEDTLRSTGNQRRLASHLLSKGISEIRWGALTEAEAHLKDSLKTAQEI